MMSLEGDLEYLLSIEMCTYHKYGDLFWTSIHEHILMRLTFRERNPGRSSEHSIELLNQDLYHL